MAEKIKLNPCHYCGNEDVKMTVHCFGEHLLFKIKCDECHSGSNIEIKSGETYELMEKAIERLVSVWNRRADNNGICTDYKDKSSLIERKALYDKVEELLIGHGYINPDTAILECLEIIENFPTADIPPCNSDTVSTDCKDYPNCKGCPIDASGGCDRE